MVAWSSRAGVAWSPSPRRFKTAGRYLGQATVRRRISWGRAGPWEYWQHHGPGRQVQNLGQATVRRRTSWGRAGPWEYWQHHGPGRQLQSDSPVPTGHPRQRRLGEVSAGADDDG